MLPAAVLVEPPRPAGIAIARSSPATASLPAEPPGRGRVSSVRAVPGSAADRRSAPRAHNCAGEDVRKGPSRPTASDAISKPAAVKLTKRVMSAEGKKKIALAQKARWAKVRKAAKKAANTEKTVETGL
jgi:hypothetical protein